MARPPMPAKERKVVVMRLTEDEAKIVLKKREAKK